MPMVKRGECVRQCFVDTAQEFPHGFAFGEAFVALYGVVPSPAKKISFLLDKSHKGGGSLEGHFLERR